MHAPDCRVSAVLASYLITLGLQVAVRGGDPRKPRRGLQVEKGPVCVRSGHGHGVVQHGPQVMDQLFSAKFFSAEKIFLVTLRLAESQVLYVNGDIGLLMTQVAQMATQV